MSALTREAVLAMRTMGARRAEAVSKRSGRPVNNFRQRNHRRDAAPNQHCTPRPCRALDAEL